LRVNATAQVCSTYRQQRRALAHPSSCRLSSPPVTMSIFPSSVAAGMLLPTTRCAQQILPPSCASHSVNHHYDTIVAMNVLASFPGTHRCDRRIARHVFFSNADVHGSLSVGYSKDSVRHVRSWKLRRVGGRRMGGCCMMERLMAGIHAVVR
jgi:hypothetical protein